MIMTVDLWPVAAALCVALSLKLAELDAQTYRVLTDVLLPADGTTTQIDHLGVSRHGLFVLEMKNHTGWICGQAGDA